MEPGICENFACVISGILCFGIRNPINDGTEFLIIGTRQQLAKVIIIQNCSRVRSTDVCPVTIARNLGSWFDEQLTMSTHISKLCGVAFFHLHTIFVSRINGNACPCI